ncbi:LacI family DNA-binding transcriptional regulator [Roseateles toxinivorans]|uniref:LacI family transcriptional regulator n=1 Tax=Roseateles toxinivorans TaxID=270368 RepID=A0A4R6QT15_9BURK|nr:LacI family DNA-binding transcriptional regulator [Roseateles toxinivorans]TDP74507.1 LacI family transcriptional regulator [Roseateles toxinivorans]
MNPTKGATLADVAAAAEVDRSTASRVLNAGVGHRVGAATRERVLAAAKALGYEPNPLARGLRTARSYTLGIAVPQLENPVFPEIIFGAEIAARSRGYALLISHSDDAGGDAGHYAQMARVSRVDGLLVATLEHEVALLASLQQTSLPYVVLNRKLDGVGNYVVFDSFAAAKLATEHLIALGHRRIAHLAGRAEGYNGQRRLAGYRAALDAAGIAYDPALVITAGYTFEGGETGMRALIDSGAALTAVVAATVLTAAGAMKLLHARSIAIPTQVSVIAIHDAAIADMLHPQLTTVRLPLREMGSVATHGLIDLVEQKTEAIAHTLPLESLVLRASTGRPQA